MLRTIFLVAALAGAFTTHAADPRKVVRIAWTSSEVQIDPQVEADESTVSLAQVLFDTPLAYDYLARPSKLAPGAADLPEITDNGATYTLRVRPGIFYTPHPVFGGKPRELTAQDFVYSMKRILDPKLKSKWLFLVEGKVRGGDEAIKLAKERGKFDYDRPIEGLQALDKYTFRIRLKTPDYSFAYILAMPAVSALAREVVEHYGQDAGFHPVGTGPYVVKDWVRSARMTLEANPNYREERFEGDAGPDERSRAIHARLKGKQLPMVGRIEITVVEEAQPRWLSFLNGDTDYLRPLPEEFAHIAMPGGRLAPNLAKKGVGATPDEIAYVTYTTLNTQEVLEDGRPNMLGGFSPERVALRRAIAMAWRIDEQILILDKNQSTRAHMLMHPAVSGHNPDFVSPTLEYNPAKAKALLDMFGFVDRDGDGYRENPDGTPLSFDHASAPTLRERQRNELWKKSMDDIGVRVIFKTVEKVPQLRRQAQLGRIQSWSYGWIADYPDGENFLQLLWKGSIGQTNYAMFDHPEYNELYERVKRMPDSPERNALMERMVKLVLVYAPWVIETYKAQNILLAPWVHNYKKHPFSGEPWKYLDVDLERLAKR